MNARPVGAGTASIIDDMPATSCGLKLQNRISGVELEASLLKMTSLFGRCREEHTLHSNAYRSDYRFYESESPTWRVG
jgi:hypothetical protein